MEFPARDLRRPGKRRSRRWQSSARETSRADAADRSNRGELDPGRIRVSTPGFGAACQLGDITARLPGMPPSSLILGVPAASFAGRTQTPISRGQRVPMAVSRGAQR